MAIKKDILSRLTMIYIGTIVFAVLIIARIIYLQTWEREKWQNKAKQFTFQDIIIEADRGDILARDGRVLANSVPYYEVRMDLRSNVVSDENFNKNIDSLAICLINLFGDDPDYYQSKDKLLQDFWNGRRKGDGYFLIRRNVNYSQFKQLQRFPIFNLGRYKGGLISLQSSVRNKPFKSLAARTVGRLANKGETKTTIGLEGAYDQYLRGSNGVQLMQKLSGNVWMPMESDNEVIAQDGYNVVSTIDVNIQDIVEHALLKRLRATKASEGCVVVIEVETGAVRAISNLTDTLGGYREFYNYALGMSLPPGSTFKLASVMALLEDGLVNLLDTVDTGNGEYSLYDFTIKDTHEGGYGKISLQKSFELSSNVGIAKFVQNSYKSNPERFIDRLYSFNLNNKLGLEIEGEGAPEIKYPGDNLWSNISMAQMSIGYELNLTPMQVLAFYNAVANNGKMMRPYFVESIRDYSKVIKQFEPIVLKSSICSQETIKKVKRLLEGVVENGTAKHIKSDNFKIAGKTGTAKIYDQVKRSYVYKYRGSFAGYFPADKPKYSCIVVIYNPKIGSYYGGAVAAPVFAEIANKIYATDLDLQTPINDDNFNYATIVDIPYAKSGYKDDFDCVLQFLGVPKQYYSDLSSDWVATQKKETFIEYKNRDVITGLMPNVVGMGARDALSLLENHGLKVNIVGCGRVVQQSIQAGARVKAGEKISLQMNKI